MRVFVSSHYSLTQFININMSKVLLLGLSLFVFQSISAQTELKLMTYNIRYDNPNDGENRWGLRKDWLAKRL